MSVGGGEQCNATSGGLGQTKMINQPIDHLPHSASEWSGNDKAFGWLDADMHTGTAKHQAAAAKVHA